MAAMSAASRRVGKCTIIIYVNETICIKPRACFNLSLALHNHGIVFVLARRRYISASPPPGPRRKTYVPLTYPLTHPKPPSPVSLRVPRQLPHVPQERPDAALHDLAGADRPLRHGPRPRRVPDAVVLDGRAVVGLDHARHEALVAVQRDGALRLLGGCCCC